MFGHQDDNSTQDNSHMDNAGATSAPTNTDDQQLTNIPGQSGPSLIIPSPSLSDVPTVQNTDQPWPPADAPASNDDQQNRDVLSPAGGYPKPPSQKVHVDPIVHDDIVDNTVNEPEEKESEPEVMPVVANDNPNDNLTSLVDDDLSSIKIQALDELYPLIDKLDLAPEDRFRTLMMMIQASDNQELVKSAYETAHNIEDEKAKAQALLDIVNEINYFTQQSNS